MAGKLTCCGLALATLISTTGPDSDVSEWKSDDWRRANIEAKTEVIGVIGQRLRAGGLPIGNQFLLDCVSRAMDAQDYGLTLAMYASMCASAVGK